VERERERAENEKSLGLRLVNNFNSDMAHC